MTEIDRIKALAKERGMSLSYLCSLVGRSRNYISNCGIGRDRITDERRAVIAEALHTTPEYLLGETDIKEKPTSIADGLPADVREIINLCESHPGLATVLLNLARSLEALPGAPGSSTK